MRNNEFISTIIMLQNRTGLTNYTREELESMDERQIQELFRKLRDRVLHLEIKNSGIFRN